MPAPPVVITGLGPVIHAFVDTDPGGRWPDQVYGCPVERNRLFAATGSNPRSPLTGLVPVIHAFRAIYTASIEDVGSRNKSGHGELWLYR